VQYSAGESKKKLLHLV